MKPRKMKLFGGDGMEKVAGLSEEKLKKIVEFLRERDAKKIYVFGSRARGDVKEGSDVDILVEFGENAPKGFEFFALHHDIAEMIGIKVDVLTLQMLDPLIRGEVEKEAILIYEE